MRHRTIVRLCLWAWAALTAAAVVAIGADDIMVERDVRAKMRDGVTLKADIYRPKPEGKYPVLLMRTPYNKALVEGAGRLGATRGYISVVQDCRGRFASEGDWYAFKNEIADGYDTVEWAAALPNSDGRVVMWGGSYVGMTQLLAALASPPHLAGITPWMAPSDFHEGAIYQGGAFEQLVAQTWTSNVAVDALTRRVNLDNFVANTPLRWVRDLPLASYPFLEVPPGPSLLTFYRDWLQHPNYDDYWEPLSVERQPEKIQVPAYHIGGWYDLFGAGTWRAYEAIKVHGGNETARRGQRLLMGPWAHGVLQSKAGEVDFGPQAKLDGFTLVLDWCDYLLKGASTTFGREKPVKIFVMGKNAWREEDDWPLARARATRYYLHSAGKANSLEGDGTLSTTAPQQETADRYVYDPTDPAPTKGGGLCCSAAAPGGAFDQRAIEGRRDVLVFTTPPFKEDFEVTGPITLELYASSSAVDTDFTAKLVDVWPNGFAQNLTDGIIRARYRNSFETPALMKPGRIYKFTIDVWATSNVFLPGHRLRLDISSSNFPRFDRNLNTGEDQGQGTRTVKATNTIFHDREHPSALILPVIPQ